MAKTGVAERLILEIVSGPLRGELHPVPANGTLVVGRLPECGISIPQDLTVSRQQFRIEYQPPECRLVHLSQTGDTRVNDVPATTTPLRDGDMLSFGSGNEIRVRFEQLPAVAEVTASAAISDRPRSNGVRSLQMKPTSSGLTLFNATEVIPVDEMLALLAKAGPVVATIDFPRLKQPLPEELAGSTYLFSWIASELQSQFSPLLVRVTGNPAAESAVQNGWGRDGIVCFGSSLGEPELLKHWQAAIGAADGKPGDAMTVYYWPKLLNMMLTCQPPAQLAPLVAGLTWLFIEAPESPGHWNLFAPESFAAKLKSSGFGIGTDQSSQAHT